ncbi:hypothetical protein J2X66_005867 [Pseudomonas sp. 3296]|uniref:ribosomal maturation YjgA family protein n=1 Tax=Pseudomonas sp. 3296 TaxID=2817753 RepID=UPI0028599853|nr:DUF2809 domain-containing protein [Pseudomonas sp. 3296]MDR6918962.1 hypothetical protein [Pseudomonas sp. 3296]
MKARFSRSYFACSIALLLLMIILATLGARWGWVRGFAGDMLAVMCVYCTFGAVLMASPISRACAALLIGLGVEFAQYLISACDLQISNRVLRIIIGATPDWWDVVAYVLGALLVLSLSKIVRLIARRCTSAICWKK